MRKLTTALLFCLLALTLHAQTGSPAEQRKWAIDTAHWLEQHPLAPDVKIENLRLLKWWTEVPDLTLTSCAGPLLETKNSKAQFVVLQSIFGSGAYLIEHPDSTRAEQTQSGVESALRAYANALAADKTVQDPFLDGLVKTAAEGHLREAYLDAKLKSCEDAERAKKR
jgi:hypothetical protein